MNIIFDPRKIGDGEKQRPETIICSYCDTPRSSLDSVCPICGGTVNNESGPNTHLIGTIYDITTGGVQPDKITNPDMLNYLKSANLL